MVARRVILFFLLILILFHYNSNLRDVPIVISKTIEDICCIVASLISSSWFWGKKSQFLAKFSIGILTILQWEGIWGN